MGVSLVVEVSRSEVVRLKFGFEDVWICNFTGLNCLGFGPKDGLFHDVSFVQLAWLFCYASPSPSFCLLQN